MIICIVTDEILSTLDSTVEQDGALVMQKVVRSAKKFCCETAVPFCLQDNEDEVTPVQQENDDVDHHNYDSGRLEY